MDKKKMNLMEFLSANPSKTKAPQRRGATEKQISYAKAIADLLELDYPDFDDFNATSEFISYNKDDYYEALDDVDTMDDDHPFYGFDYDEPKRG